MKQGGHSWNSSGNAKQGVQTKFACQICGRQYKMVLRLHPYQISGAD